MLSPIQQSILRELNTAMNDMEEDTTVMILCNGRLPDGKDFYAFLDMKARKLADFYEAVRLGKELKLGDFGEVVRSGEGVEPPADVRREMEENYNVDYGLGEKLRYLFAV